MTFGFGQKPDFILKFRSMYQPVGNCYVGDIRMVIEMLYFSKISIFLQRSNNEVLLFETMPIKSLFLIYLNDLKPKKTSSEYPTYGSKERKKERNKEIEK